MSSDFTITKFIGFMVGLGGLILVISLFFLGVTLYHILIDSNMPGKTVDIILLSVIGIIIGLSFLTVSVLHKHPEKQY